MSRTRRIIKRFATTLGLLLLGSVGVFLAAVAWPQSQAQPQRASGPLAITDVTLVDIRAGRLVAGQSVVVSGGRITAVGPVAETEVPAGARVIDGRGRYVMPALWDMHTHVYAISPLLDMPLYIAYGVTNVRDLQGCPASGDPFIACYEDKQRWTAEALAGTRVGPRIFEASSFMANGPGMAARLGDVPAFFDVQTPEQARDFVRHFVGRADSIKVYDGIPRQAYFALVDEATRHGLVVVGHKPRAVSATEAAVHQRSIEHARFLLHESFDGSDALRASVGTPAWREDRRAMLDRHDPAAAARIFGAMRANGTYYVPTHLTRWADAYADSPEVREDPALAYLHPLMKMQWLEDIDAVLARDPGPEARATYVDFYEKGLELTRQAHDAGVRIMVGTDYIAPGLDVHRELEQLVKAGLSPQQALAAATIVPAGYAGASGRYGDVAPGRIADLILLGADPLADIRNTRSIQAVVFNGAVYDQQAIADLKAGVRSNARSWSTGAKILWRFVLNPASY
ncbi:MAG TPA: amidohydrolase family protein [Arenimonas sp.]|nr:amidohydrolase family protein [Arenimonas sp.]